MSKLVIYDLYIFLKSAEFASRLPDKYGVPVKGIAHIMKDILYEVRKGSSVVVATEGGNNFRKSISDTYKSNRNPKDTRCKIQSDMLTELLAIAGIPVLCERGLEADDVIYSLVNKYKSKFDKVEIFSNDMDLAHNIEENVYIRPANTRGKLVSKATYVGVLSTEKAIVRFNTITPYKILTGDKSDNMGPMVFNNKALNPIMVYEAYVDFLVKNKVIRPFKATDESYFDTITGRNRDLFTAWMKQVKVISPEEYDYFDNRCDIFYPRNISGNPNLGLNSQINIDALVAIMYVIGCTESIGVHSNKYNSYLNEMKRILKDYGKSLQDNTYSATTETSFHTDSFSEFNVSDGVKEFKI